MTTVTTRTNIFKRLGGSIKAIGFGILLFFIAFPVLFLNEGRAVKTARALAEGAAAVVSIDANNPGQAGDGALVHFTGEATTDEVLEDPLFGARVQALRLERQVEMFQWQENTETRQEEKLGGTVETTTTYTYRQDWSSTLRDSSRFQESAAHQNPASMPYTGESFEAQVVTVGAFQLGDALRSRAGVPTELAAQEGWLEGLPAELRGRAKLSGGKIFVGQNPSTPQVGDLRISFQVVNPSTVSVIGRKSGNLVEQYTTSNNRQIGMVNQGTQSAEAMFEAAEAGNRMMTWILRFLGFFMMFSGIAMVLAPAKILASVIPFLGRIVGAGTRLVAIAIAAPLSLFTIALGWIVYRPLLGILLFLVGAAILGGLFVLIKKAKAVVPEAEPVL